MDKSALCIMRLFQDSLQNFMSKKKR